MNKAVMIMLTTIIIISLITASPGMSQTYKIYAFVTTDSPIYLPGSHMVAEAYVYPLVQESREAIIKFYFTDLPNAPTIPEIHVTIPSANDARFIHVESQPVTVPDVNDGTYHLHMQIIVNNQVIYEDTVDFWIRHGPPSGKPPMILFVWHNHQAPNYWPDGTFFANWHIDHFFKDSLTPYFKIDNTYPDMGTYYLHYYLLKKYPNIKVNLHYSPSLLYQLYIAANKGFTIYDPNTGSTRKIPPNSSLAQAIKDFFKGLKQLHDEGRAYLLTTEFAHTIAGYIMEKLNIPYLLKYDIWLGKEWTKKVLGVDTDAIWTAEMAWSDKLVPIYLDLGIKYTVLDGTYHFPGARGDKGTIFEPYIIKDNEGRELIVFFRDQEVSDGYIGFTNNDWGDARTADRDARALYYHIYNKHSFKNYKYPPIEVIAADGENWILFAPSHANGALFLDRIYKYVSRLTDQGIMNTGTFSDAVKVHPPERVLTSITWTSWLGGWGKWTTEQGAKHKEEWEKLYERIGKYKAYMYYKNIDSYNKFIDEIKKNPKFNESVIDLIHAIDSDFWWSEFFSPGVIDAWLEEFDHDISNIMKYKISLTTEPSQPVAQTTTKAIVTITNNNDYQMRNTIITLSMPGINATTKQVTISPGDSVNVSLIFKVDKAGTKQLVLTMYTPNAKIGKETFYLETRYFKIKFLSPIDLSLKISVIGPNGVLGGINPTPPGTHKIFATVSLAEGETASFDVPVKIYLKIGGQTYIKEATMFKGENSVTEVFNIDLKTGTYTYEVNVVSPYDPFIDNNKFTGQIIVTQTRQENTGENTQLLIILAIILWIIVAVLAALYYIKHKRS
ncbi:glycoside hydrolase family 57 protein [Staphylothermus hellenicus]|uniref:Glycoside hydrolase family 57 n=1 Tax=Staphylothermus hellenicus (strain DSM 12710 / JCM 10830 / BK20S6-10-b1 / P8) TaxID=591019 RepID=D7D8Q4_STAHD|nr:glycoside hydrolase family 57 protein [Staphylothermus hellenicus]ADI32150.1 glycoside hydrolase family 57 [Staphylothermus hellenicus DSM 12710]